MLIRKKLTDAEFSNAALRYNEGCDCVQFTPDGGTTWIDQPANDPRSSDAYRLPPITGSNTQCRAAEGMTELVRRMVNARINDITDAELAGTILGIVAFIPGFNILWALILAFVSLAFTIAREILEAAFTEPVYEQLRCLFYCNIDENGQMSQSQFDEVYAALIDFDAVARTWIQAVMDLVGAVGMSNAGVALEAAADCDDCECAWCYEWTTFGDWTIPAGYAQGSRTTALYIAFASSTVKHIEFEYTWNLVGGGGASARAIWGAANFGGSTLTYTSPLPNVSPSGASWTGSATMTGVTVAANATVGSGRVVTITRILLRGVGDNPFGMDNCE